jgi:hypothetical protein
MRREAVMSEYESSQVLFSRSCPYLWYGSMLFKLSTAMQYKETGERQYVHTVRDLYKRGSIYFTTKDNEKVSAATIKSGYLLAIDPSRIEDAEGVYTCDQLDYPYR